MQDLAIRAHEALGALDVSRVDMRCDAYGNPFLIEINTLPGLSPGFSDLCVIANAEGISYENLLLEILYLGASRWGLVEKTPGVEVNIPISESVSNRTPRQRATGRAPYAMRARSLLR